MDNLMANHVSLTNSSLIHPYKSKYCWALVSSSKDYHIGIPAGPAGQIPRADEDPHWVLFGNSYSFSMSFPGFSHQI